MPAGKLPQHRQHLGGLLQRQPLQSEKCRMPHGLLAALITQVQQIGQQRGVDDDLEGLQVARGKRRTPAGVVQHLGRLLLEQHRVRLIAVVACQVPHVHRPFFRRIRPLLGQLGDV
ncbi:hypothetical protein [Prosthecobacter sp.]|uniref:hypothetical protein n=1 Tax=Prosthecobacter sp. TaxID=1965333 RepID=UPI0037849F30